MANRADISGLSKYQTIIVICMSGDYPTQITFHKDIGITRFVLNSYHSANFNIYGYIDINYDKGYVVTTKMIGGWTDSAILITKVYGIKI